MGITTFQLCKPVLAAWHDDCADYNDLHGGVCTFCECPKSELGDPVTPKKDPPRDHNAYWKINDDDTAESADRLADLHVHQGFNAFRHIPCTVAKLPKADLPTMQLGILDRLHKWLLHFMRRKAPDADFLPLHPQDNRLAGIPSLAIEVGFADEDPWPPR